jgi:hypothetical protein
MSPVLTGVATHCPLSSPLPDHDGQLLSFARASPNAHLCVCGCVCSTLCSPRCVTPWWTRWSVCSLRTWWGSRSTSLGGTVTSTGGELLSRHCLRACVLPRALLLTRVRVAPPVFTPQRAAVQGGGERGVDSLQQAAASYARYIRPDNQDQQVPQGSFTARASMPCPACVVLCPTESGAGASSSAAAHTSPAFSLIHCACTPHGRCCRRQREVPVPPPRPLYPFPGRSRL